MPGIDVIRSAARKQAWYHNNDGEHRTYNIFGRPPRNPRRITDPELGGTRDLSLTQSENQATSPIEKNRHAGWDHKDVRRSGTAGPSFQKHDLKEEAESPTKEKLSNESLTPVATTTTEDGVGKKGSLKRRVFSHLPFSGKKEDTEQGLERSETKRSSKKGKKGELKTSLTIPQQIKVVLYSWINILLVFVPVGLAFEYAHLNGPATFVVNFIAIVPLAAMLGFATEELALYVGETFGGLLNATFGNATELIVSVIALTQQKVIIVQTSLIGSMLSNLLLVLGMCFFFGGVNRLEQFFNITVAQAAASLLALAIGALVTPTAFRIFSPDDAGVTPTSRAAAILLLITYICYLFFQLRTHLELYNTPSQKVEKQNLVRKKGVEVSDASKGIASAGAASAAASGGAINGGHLVQERASDSSSSDDEKDEGDEPQLGFWMAIATLSASTALIAVTSDGMVSAIDSITGPGGLSEEFVGLILVPIVGNAAEHATAVTVAIKDKMDLAIGVAVGSSLQIALLVIPIMVLLSWFGVGSPSTLDLNFDGFQVVVLFIAIVLVNYVIQDGRSNWLEGAQLFILYVIFAVAAWYYPANAVPT